MINRVSVAAWNVAHQIYRSRLIPETVGIALERISADVLFLSEFVDRDDDGKARLLQRLDAAGYLHRTMAPAPDRYGHNSYNRIFVASRLPFEVGDLAPPTTTEFAVSNFLHLRLADSEIELIGLRAPSYSGTELRSYRDQLTGILRSAGHRALAVTGDWNNYPFGLIREEYAVPDPVGGWSHVHSKGTSQLDYVAHTATLRVRVARYVYDVEPEGIKLVGPKAEGAISDHAALAFTAEIGSDD